uniref:Uncharacterized protein n=1 Tax=Panagrolaimus davidi TaxID=227884 RepID=A0A914QFV2_9BILA
MVALYLETFDSDANCAEVATNLWGLLRFAESPSLSKDIYDALIHEQYFVQDEAAECINDLGSQFPDYISTAITDLFGLYDKYLEIIPPVKDEVGRVIKDGRDPSHERLGIGKALARLADCLESKHIQKFIELVADRLDERDSQCHSLLRNAGVIAIKKHGEKVMSTLLPFLDKKLSDTPEKKENDNMRQGLVVLLGTLGMYLETQPDRVLQIFKKLISTLSIPSEAVQKSVADCLPQLVGFIENHATDTLESLLHIMEASANYGERRGAAYGIAAIIYGLRPYIIVEMQLLHRVEKMITSKSNINQRESALLIMELLFKILGKSSEPFMPAFIPSLKKYDGSFISTWSKTYFTFNFESNC